MKHKNSIVTISLNILFCTALLWFFSRNAFLRPYAGSTFKEILAGLLLLGTVYANYFILYPKLYAQNAHVLYWLSLTAVVFFIAFLDLTIAYPCISKYNASAIGAVGFLNYFAKRLLFIAGRNLAFNFFPFMFRERKQLQQSLETEVRVVYQYARVIDVCDGDNNCQHIPIDDIFYCKKNGNETDVYTVGGVKYTRYCSIKYLVQLFGNEDFIRISPSYLVPFQHIASCDGKTVVMNNMPWTETSLAFDLDTQRYPHAPAAIEEYLRACQRSVEVVQPDSKNEKNKKTPSIPPKEKLDAVLGYIQEHPGCRSTEIMSYTSYSQTTMDRCLFELKKQGLIKYSGSKKKGGYYLIVPPQEGVGVESESLQMQTNLEKPESDAHE